MEKITIRNMTKNVVIGSNFTLCNGVFSKFRGLMFTKNIEQALIFKFDKEKIISLHMLFVFYPIDVLFLDKNKIVVDIINCFKPFTLYNSKKKAMYAIEMPCGVINRSVTDIGDKIAF